MKKLIPSGRMILKVWRLVLSPKSSNSFAKESMKKLRYLKYTSRPTPRIIPMVLNADLLFSLFADPMDNPMK